MNLMNQTKSGSIPSDLTASNLVAADFIDDLAEATIQTYFETLNAGDFQATANLFADEGQLLPPFESVIVGPEAILAYLEAEAQGMRALPQEMQESDSSDLDCIDSTSINVLGKVQTSLFTVNVKWRFQLNAQAEILSVEVKLLASLQDLLRLKR
jgi:hypothetical protein